MVDANGYRREFTYDQGGRPIRVTYPDGSFTERHYDALWRLIEEVDEEGRATSFEYDTLGRLITVALPAPAPGKPGPITHYTYDEAGNRLTRVDAMGRVTRYRYDRLNRLIGRTLPGGESESMIYDATGNLLSHTDFNGNTINFEYDVMGRLIKKTLPDGSTVAFTYTPTGMRKEMMDSQGTTIYAYDSMDRLTDITYPDGTGVHYTYDPMGNLLGIASPAGTVGYEYDGLGRLLRVVGPQGEIRYTYDAAGRRIKVLIPNGIVTEYAYDTRNRLTQVIHRAGDGTILNAFTYDLLPVGQRIAVTEADGSRVTYAYDGLGRLIHEVRTGSNPYTISYEYDPVGNRTRMVRDGQETLYTYDANDRLLKAGGVTYTYDANGNTVQMTDGARTRTYDYDGDNRLIRFTDGTEIITFAYDADGNMTGMSTPSGDVTYIVTPMNLTGFPQVLEERDSTGVLQASYSYGDDLLSVNRSGETRFYHYDGQMSTRILSARTGAVTDTYTYDAFGNLVGSAGATDNPYLYTGERFVSGPGLYYLRARHYNSITGRFMTGDTFTGFDRDPATQHRYLYVNADPVNRLDPGGHFGFSIAELVMSDMARTTLRVGQLAARGSRICSFIKTAETVGDLLFMTHAAFQIMAFTMQVDRLMSNYSSVDMRSNPSRWKWALPSLSLKGPGYIHSIDLQMRKAIRGDWELNISIKASSVKRYLIHRIRPSERRYFKIGYTLNLTDPAKSKISSGGKINALAIKGEACMMSIDLMTISLGIDYASYQMMSPRDPFGVSLDLTLSLFGMGDFKFNVWKKNY